MKSKAAIDALSALANEHRLAVFRLLVQAGPEGRPAGAIANALDLPASSLSFHLAHLNRAGLITQSRDGRSLIYAADFAAMNGLVGFLTAGTPAPSTAPVPARPDRAAHVAEWKAE